MIEADSREVLLDGRFLQKFLRNFCLHWWVRAQTVFVQIASRSRSEKQLWLHFVFTVCSQLSSLACLAVCWLGLKCVALHDMFLFLHRTPSWCGQAFIIGRDSRCLVDMWEDTDRDVHRASTLFPLDTLGKPPWLCLSYCNTRDPLIITSKSTWWGRGRGSPRTSSDCPVLSALIRRQLQRDHDGLFLIMRRQAYAHMTALHMARQWFAIEISK